MSVMRLRWSFRNFAENFLCSLIFLRRTERKTKKRGWVVLDVSSCPSLHGQVRCGHKSVTKVFSCVAVDHPEREWHGTHCMNEKIMVLQVYRLTTREPNNHPGVLEIENLGTCLPLARNWLWLLEGASVCKCMSWRTPAHRLNTAAQIFC